MLHRYSRALAVVPVCWLTDACQMRYIDGPSHFAKAFSIGEQTNTRKKKFYFSISFGRLHHSPGTRLALSLFKVFAFIPMAIERTRSVAVGWEHFTIQSELRQKICFGQNAHTHIECDLLSGEHILIFCFFSFYAFFRNGVNYIIEVSWY